MTNEEKALELVGGNYMAFNKEYSAALKMAEWKDKEWKEKIRKWLSFNTNWNSEFDEDGRNPDYGKIDEMFDEIEKRLI